MSTSPTIGIESVMDEPGLAVTKGYTGTPDQATGYEATNLADESPATEWRTTDTDRDSSRALVRWGRKRYLRTVAGIEHNLERHGVWRWTADDDWAVKPAVLFDGIDDKGVTTTTLTGSADVTLIGRFRLPSQQPANNTSAAALFAVGNAVGNGARFRVYFQQGNAAGTPFALIGQVFNWSSPVTLVPSSPIYPSGQYVDVAVRYRDSDQRTDLLFNGSQVATATASASWPNNGDEKITVGATNAGALLGRSELVHLEYWSEYLPDERIAAFRASPVATTARNLLGAWHVTESSGSTVADVLGASDMTLTGGAWVERVRHDARWSTGEILANGQWRTRPAFQMGAGISATSPSLGAAPRSITISFLVRVSITDTLNVALGFFGPSFGDCELGFTLTATGEIRVRTNRAASTLTATSTTPINDGALRRIRATLDGRANTMSLYVGTAGGAEVLQQTTSGLNDYDAVAACLLVVGTGSGVPTSVTADWRAYSEVRLEEDDPLTIDVGVSDPELLAKVPLDGSVYDSVDPARSYTVPAESYGEVEQPASRNLPAADARRTKAGAGLFSRNQRLLIAESSSPVEVTEGYLEIWDPGNSDGYIRLAVLLPQDAFQALHGRAWGAERRPKPRAAVRSIDGLVSRERGYESDVLVIRLPSVRTDGDSAGAADASEADEVLSRLLRHPRERLVTVISSPWVAAHRLPEHAIVGTIQGDRGVRDPAYGMSELELEVESVRRPPSS